jgi:hypothetical protein
MTLLCSANNQADFIMSFQNLWHHFVQLTIWRIL